MSTATPPPELQPSDASGDAPGATALPDTEVKQPERPKLLQVLGPGLITGASDDDPSGIATYSQAGAQFGYGLTWTLLFSWPLMCAIQEISARIGRITGRGLAGNLRHHYPRGVVHGLVGLLVVANTINLGADLGAMAAALKLLIGGPELLYVGAFALVSVLLGVLAGLSAGYLRWLDMPMMRVMDGIMAKAGLSGKSFLPLFSSYACAIPGVMATRTIDSAKERLVTIFVAPWMSCSARLPVYFLIIPLLLHEKEGTWKQAAVMFAIYALGTITAFIVAPLETALMFFVGFQIGRFFGWSVTDSVYLGGIMSSSCSHAYSDLNLKLSSGIFGSTFFMLTGFHGFHVLLGTLMLLIITLRLQKGHFTADRHFGFEGAAWYWHFVDVVWLGLYFLVYWL